MRQQVKNAVKEVDCVNYKLSNYNFFFDFKEEGKNLVYNSISNGLAEVDGDIFSLLKEGGKRINDLTNNPENQDLVKSLIKGHIIIEEDFDEVEFLKVKLNLNRYGLKTLALTIVPTLDCNLKCIYCYEGTRSKKYMDEATENALIEFAKKRIKEVGYKSLHVTWFGGEPLLNLDTIYRLSEAFIKTCKSRKVSYGATMVSNGTLFTEEIVDKLKKYRVQNIQVTIDGVQEIHDKRRPFVDGQRSSFTRIIENVSKILGKIPINIRINVDKTNYSDTIKLLDAFRNMGWMDNRKKIFIYIGYTREWTSKCSNIASNCFSMREFSEAEMKFHEELAVKGYDVGNIYPSLSSICVAASPHGFGIDPYGELYNCWSDVGNKEAYFGNIREPIKINKKHLKWLSYDPLNMYDDCKKCKLFPICAGGCPYVSIFQKEKINSDPFYNCTPWKLFMEKKIKKFLQQKLSKQNNKTKGGK